MAISENASARGLLLQTNRSSTFLFAQKRFPQCLLLLERRWVEWIQSLLHFFNSPPALPSTLTQQRNLRPYKQQQCCQSKIEYKYPPFHSWSFPSSYFLLSYLSFFSHNGFWTSSRPWRQIYILSSSRRRICAYHCQPWSSRLERFRPDHFGPLSPQRFSWHARRFSKQRCCRLSLLLRWSYSGMLLYWTATSVVCVFWIRLFIAV